MPRRHELAGGNGRPVGPTEARNQSWKPQGPVGLLQVHWVSLWVRSLQTNKWYQQSVEPYAYLPMSGRHRPTDTFAGGRLALRSLGRMLLSSNVIYICVRVVMLVRMVRTLLFAAARVKSCPGMHSSCVIASLSGCARTVGHPPISGGGPGTVKRKLLVP